MIPAGAELGVPAGKTAMAIAWGDAWTNLIQSFWALPALAIAGLGARDIMGFCVVNLLYAGFITCLCFLFKRKASFILAFLHNKLFISHAIYNDSPLYLRKL